MLCRLLWDKMHILFPMQKHEGFVTFPLKLKHFFPKYSPFAMPYVLNRPCQRTPPYTGSCGCNRPRLTITTPWAPPACGLQDTWVVAPFAAARSCYNCADWLHNWLHMAAIAGLSPGPNPAMCWVCLGSCEEHEHRAPSACGGTILLYTYYIVYSTGITVRVYRPAIVYYYTIQGLI